MRLNPITAKRLKAFRRHRRGWYSLCLLVLLYLVSLGAELLCNGVPLVVRHQGQVYFPVFKFYPESRFVSNGRNTPPDYRELERDGVWMIWPLIPWGPNESCPSDSLKPFLRYDVRLELRPQVIVYSVDDALVVRQCTDDAAACIGRPLGDLVKLPDDLKAAIQARFANQKQDAFSRESIVEQKRQIITLSEYKPRKRLLKQVRVMLRRLPLQHADKHWRYTPGQTEQPPDMTDALAKELQPLLQLCTREQGLRQSRAVTVDGMDAELSVERERVRFPFRPVKEHPMGLDDAGRDVLARLLYALRTSLTFGLILVICSMSVGAVAGMIQGYAGGMVDLAGQRFLEIWSALPFLYVIILLGSIYGPGFWLMIVCYALFNWIGISYYMRAEVLRLRRQPFIEAAKCLGLPRWRILVKHVLPNALVPLVTFFPFSLVGAIGSLAALDYLGFGLPPPTPSIGQLLQQAQAQRWAWWLILYPSLLLFVMMLLGVFVGEGIRDAFDPKRQSRILG